MNVHPEGMARIECRVDGDPRLIAGAAMIAAHVARHAGLAGTDASSLAEATLQTCRAVLESMEGTDSRTIRLTVSELPNCMEVAVEPLIGNAIARPLSSEQSCHLADRVRQTLKSAADDVKVELKEGRPRVTIVRNCGAGKHPFTV